jgi:hypothetical protein
MACQRIKSTTRKPFQMNPEAKNYVETTTVNKLRVRGYSNVRAIFSAKHADKFKWPPLVLEVEAERKGKHIKEAIAHPSLSMWLLEDIVDCMVGLVVNDKDIVEEYGWKRDEARNLDKSPTDFSL